MAYRHETGREPSFETCVFHNYHANQLELYRLAGWLNSEVLLLTILPFYQPSAAPRPLLRDSFVSGFHALRARTLADTKRILGLGSVRLLCVVDRKSFTSEENIT
jgi:hypothetical protein